MILTYHNAAHNRVSAAAASGPRPTPRTRPAGNVGDDPRIGPALDALAAWVTGGAGRVKLALERVNGEPVVGSPWEPMLVEAGFRQGPKKLTLSA